MDKLVEGTIFLLESYLVLLDPVSQNGRLQILQGEVVTYRKELVRLRNSGADVGRLLGRVLDSLKGLLLETSSGISNADEFTAYFLTWEKGLMQGVHQRLDLTPFLDPERPINGHLVSRPDLKEAVGLVKANMEALAPFLDALRMSGGGHGYREDLASRYESIRDRISEEGLQDWCLVGLLGELEGLAMEAVRLDWADAGKEISQAASIPTRHYFASQKALLLRWLGLPYPASGIPEPTAAAKDLGRRLGYNPMAAVLEEDIDDDRHELWAELVCLRLENREDRSTMGKWRSLHKRILAGRPDKAIRLAALQEASSTSSQAASLTSSHLGTNVLVMVGSLGLGLVLLVLAGLLYWKRRRWRKRGKPSRIVTLLRLQD